MPEFEYTHSAELESAIEAARKAFAQTPPAPDISFEKAPRVPPRRNEPPSPLGRLFGGLTGGLFRDHDTVLLLALILLLAYDGGDRMLILALVYIMS